MVDQLGGGVGGVVEGDSRHQKQLRAVEQQLEEVNTRVSVIAGMLPLAEFDKLES